MPNHQWRMLCTRAWRLWRMEFFSDLRTYGCRGLRGQHHEDGVLRASCGRFHSSSTFGADADPVTVGDGTLLLYTENCERSRTRTAHTACSSAGRGDMTTFGGFGAASSRVTWLLDGDPPHCRRRSDWWSVPQDEGVDWVVGIRRPSPQSSGAWPSAPCMGIFQMSWRDHDEAVAISFGPVEARPSSTLRQEGACVVLLQGSLSFSHRACRCADRLWS